MNQCRRVDATKRLRCSATTALVAAVAFLPAAALAQSTTTFSVDRLVTAGAPGDGFAVWRPDPVVKRSVAPAVLLAALAASCIGSGAGFLALSASKRSDALAVGTMLVAKHGGCVPQWASFDAPLCSVLEAKIKADGTFHSAAVGTFIAGGAAAAGTALYLLWPSPRANAAEVYSAHVISLTPILGPTGHGLLVSGAF